MVSLTSWKHIRIFFVRMVVAWFLRAACLIVRCQAELNFANDHQSAAGGYQSMDGVSASWAVFGSALRPTFLFWLLLFWQAAYSTHWFREGGVHTDRVRVSIPFAGIRRIEMRHYDSSSVGILLGTPPNLICLSACSHSSKVTCVVSTVSASTADEASVSYTNLRIMFSSYRVALYCQRRLWCAWRSC